MSREKINNFTDFGIFLSNRKQKSLNMAFRPVLSVGGIKKALPL
jgi:hypothetical protein